MTASVPSFSPESNCLAQSRQGLCVEVIPTKARASTVQSHRSTCLVEWALIHDFSPASDGFVKVGVVFRRLISFLQLPTENFKVRCLLTRSLTATHYYPICE